MTALISLLLIIGAIKVRSATQTDKMENFFWIFKPVFIIIFFSVQRNKFMMLPFVVLAIMLAVGMLISVIYTAVMLFIGGKTLNGSLWLVFGLISIGT